MAINTAQANGRRQLRFESFNAILADAEQLASRPCRTLGNWTVGQNLDHLARTVRISFDGPHILAPWFARKIVAPFLRKKFINDSMSAGFQFTKQMEHFRPDDNASAAPALEELRRQYARLEKEQPSEPHPFFGPMSHEEWIGMQLRHAELHLSFLVPENA
jgi:Protein of unknown function (DUF1569)